MFARVEDHVRGDAKFPGGDRASCHPANHGVDRLPLPQYPRIQSEATGRSLPEGGPAGRVADDRGAPKSATDLPLDLATSSSAFRSSFSSLNARTHAISRAAQVETSSEGIDRNYGERGRASPSIKFRDFSSRRAKVQCTCLVAGSILFFVDKDVRDTSRPMCEIQSS